jgi:DNA processing protein
MCNTTSIPSSAIPKTFDALVDWLRLIRSRRIGPVTFFKLIHQYGDATQALKHLPEIARDAGLKTYEAASADQAKAELQRGKAFGARAIFAGGKNYPQALLDIDDPPPFLWVKGDVAQFDKDAIGIVGARNASSLGTRMARTMAGGLGEAGFAVVSGLARGVDAAAHAGSLNSGTIAVLAGGIDQPYPRENALLYEQIGKQGVMISERPMGHYPTSRCFPRRNRLISGLSRALVVVEAAAKSGTMITVDCALRQGREVFAVPGHPFDSRVSGCNNLIRDGATLVTSAAHVIAVIENIAPKAKTQTPPVPAKIDRPTKTSAPTEPDVAQKILDLLSVTPVSEDQVVRDLSLSSQVVAAQLTSLELDGKVTRYSGGTLALSA